MVNLRLCAYGIASACCWLAVIGGAIYMVAEPPANSPEGWFFMSIMLIPLYATVIVLAVNMTRIWVRVAKEAEFLWWKK